MFVGQAQAGAARIGRSLGGVPFTHRCLQMSQVVNLGKLEPNERLVLRNGTWSVNGLRQLPSSPGGRSQFRPNASFEATAEMFELWWCRGESCSPTVAFFGELLDEFFPQAV